MLKIHTLPLGAYQTNCYIVHNDTRQDCLVIDPGYEPAEVLSRLETLGLAPAAVFLTHGHFDHVGGVKHIAAETDCRVYLNPEDLSMPPMMTNGPLYYTDTYAEGDVLNIAGLEVRVLHTPGHTPGSVCLLIGDAMFSGDTLFAGSCGRTDLPGGSRATIERSLRRLAGIEKNYAVYPGHGESTTLDEEKMYNPYLR